MSTIYITQQNASLKIQHNYLKVFHQKKQCICIPIRNISQFVIFGNMHLPREIIKIVNLYHIPALILTQEGEYLGRLENPSQPQPKYLTHQHQRLRDIEFRHATA